MRYEWDAAKAKANERKHGVRFADAVVVLEDERALTREDPQAQSEQRFVTLGMDASATLLVVIYTYRDPDVIRIISAWKASKAQRKLYEEERR